MSLQISLVSCAEKTDPLFFVKDNWQDVSQLHAHSPPSFVCFSVKIS